MRHRYRVSFLLILVLALAAGVYFVAVNPAAFGLYHDDGIYVVCAKSLATGQGYRIISFPGEPWQTKYPPLYPFLLSLVWRAYPNFPANIFPMMLISVLASLAFFWVTFRYLTACGYAGKGLALGIVGLTAFHSKVIIVGSGLYSEIIFALLSIVALYQIERYAAQDRPSVMQGLSAGLLLGALILTRTAGVTLLCAGCFYLVRRKRWRQVPWLAVPAGLCLLGWVFWCYKHPIYSTTHSAAYLSWYTNYFADFRYLVPDWPAFLQVLRTNLFYFIFVIPAMVFNLSPAQVVQWVFLQVMVPYGGIVLFLGFIREIVRGLRLMSIYVILSLAFLAAYPYFIDRYLLPILPFLLLYLFRGLEPLRRLTARSHSGGWPHNLVRGLAGAVILAFALLILWTYPAGLGPVLRSSKVQSASIKRDYAVQDWIRQHTRPSDILVCYQDPLYYLHTGRKAIRSLNRDRDRMMRFYYHGSGLTNPSVNLLDIISDLGGNYLIVTDRDFSLEGVPEFFKADLRDLVARTPEVFTLVFESQGRYAQIYRIALP